MIHMDIWICVHVYMCTYARNVIKPRVELGELIGSPGSASVSPAQFLVARHHESFKVMLLDQETAEGAELRRRYHKLLERFPDTIAPMVGEEQLQTEIGRAKAVVQLVNKHSGEIVEMDRTKMSWVLHALEPGSASVQWSEQWNCKEDGGSTCDTDEAKDAEYVFIHCTGHQHQND